MMTHGGGTPEKNALISEAVAIPFSRRSLFTIRVVLVGLAVASLLLVTAGTGRMQLPKERLQRVVRLDLLKEPEPCVSYPWLVYQELTYSNLGNVGPDSGNGEGMVIRARDMGGSDPARLGMNTFLVLNSTNDKYKAAAAQQNGLQGRFGALNMPGSSELNFKLSFRDENQMELTMKRFALTFFDLDSDVDLDFAESVAIAGFKEYFTTLETEIQINKLSDGFTNFAATTVGTDNDNPLNPMAMTQQQKNRAVSFIFENVTTILGSVRTSSGSPARGAGFRVFNFVSKNSLVCARDAAEIPGLPLQDLNYKLPMKNPVVLPANAIFELWVVNIGDRVEKGDTLAFINDDGISKEVKSDKAGTVIAQQPLMRGDIIGERLIELNAAVIELDKLDSGTPWWIWLLCILAILCCCMCCLFCVMKKAPVKEEPYQHLEAAGLDFHDGEKIHRIFPKYRPLGIKHDHEAPIIVREFIVNSYATSELEIQRGWKLVAINGEQLKDSADFAWVSNKLGDYMKDFDLWPLALGFKAKGNDVTTLEFLSRPIGVEFENRAPIRVSSVWPGTPAEKKGIEPGMLLTKIGSEDVSGKRPYKEVLNLFKEAVISLDTSDGNQVAVAGQDHCFDGQGGHATVKES